MPGDNCSELYVDEKQDKREMLENSRGETLSWQDVSVYAITRGQNNTFVRLIDNVRGAAKPGHLTAIIGASGAGKSSLMMALAFRTGPGFLVHGEVRANGLLVDSSYMMRHSGYMHQEDLFVETMTVFEHLSFMARMKLDGRSRTSDIRQRVERLLRDVGLIERRDTRIGGCHIGDKVLSGGERKRLAFAAELLTDPKILFLDEPTTGQDSHSASLLVGRLTSFAAKGRTVLCTIHQPSSVVFDSFDRIILLANGRVAFAGTTERAIRFFASLGYACPRNYNPADFLVATLAGGQDVERTGGTARKICDSFLISDASNEIGLLLETQLRLARCSDTRREPFPEMATSPCETRENGVLLLSSGTTAPRWRFFWLVHRGFLQVLRDPSVQIMRIVQKVSVATIAGLCFVGAVNLDQLGIQATQGVIFILVSENAFFPMYATLALIPQELPLLRREYRDGMYPLPLYYVARMFSLMPGLMLEPLLFATTVYWLTGLRHSIEAFGLTLLVVLLTMNVSTACGCFFSALFGSVPLAMAYLVPFDYLLMITMGPFIKLGSLPVYVRWIKYVSWLLHSCEALSVLQWKGVHNISCETFDTDMPCLTEGSEVLLRYDFDESNLWPDLALMSFVYLVFHVLGCVCLWSRCRSS